MPPDLNDAAALILECRRLREQSQRRIDDTAFFCDRTRSTLAESRRLMARNRPVPTTHPGQANDTAASAARPPSLPGVPPRSGAGRG
jgi:hypothetical protein